jgi:hypothetical protein
MSLASTISGLFKRRPFEPEVILLAVGWETEANRRQRRNRYFVRDYRYLQAIEESAMRLKVHITLESGGGESETLEVARLERGSLRPDTLRLSLAEARAILAGLEQSLIERQAAEFIAQAQCCSRCGSVGLAPPRRSPTAPFTTTR